MKILLTGGAGFIGSHTYLALIDSGYTPVILDNFSNSNRKVIRRLEKLTNANVLLEVGDVCNLDFVKTCFTKHDFKAVIHFAAYKAVAESVANPLIYYRNNVDGLLTLLDAMSDTDCSKFVYSSSATVYGNPKQLPITEDCPLHHVNPYGHTKILGEEILSYVQKSNPAICYAILRYFNPVGAHESGLIGEDPRGTPNNLMPYISQVALGVKPTLQVFGNDYPTQDGTGVRDYIHVVDLAEGHVSALQKLNKDSQNIVVNLGTGRGYSVLEIVKIYESVSNKKIPISFKGRRPGDIAECYADVSRAQRILGWKTKKDIKAMCADAWRWQINNPEGFNSGD